MVSYFTGKMDWERSYYQVDDLVEALDFGAAGLGSILASDVNYLFSFFLNILQLQQSLRFISFVTYLQYTYCYVRSVSTGTGNT